MINVDVENMLYYYEWWGNIFILLCFFVIGFGIKSCVIMEVENMQLKSVILYFVDEFLGFWVMLLYLEYEVLKLL